MACEAGQILSIKFIYIHFLSLSSVLLYVLFVLSDTHPYPLESDCDVEGCQGFSQARREGASPALPSMTFVIHPIFRLLTFLFTAILLSTCAPFFCPCHLLCHSVAFPQLNVMSCYFECQTFDGEHPHDRVSESIRYFPCTGTYWRIGNCYYEKSFRQDNAWVTPESVSVYSATQMDGPDVGLETTLRVWTQ